MAGWLPQGWEVPDEENKVARALRAVREREARRRRRVRAALTVPPVALGALVLALLFFPGLFRRGASVPQEPSPQWAARAKTPQGEGPNASAATVPAPAVSTAAPKGEEVPRAVPASPRRSVEVTPRLEKAGDAVVVTWSGDPEREYVVYRCARPTFDACDAVAHVRGTRWTDREADDGPMVFYKVEPKA